MALVNNQSDSQLVLNCSDTKMIWTLMKYTFLSNWTQIETLGSLVFNEELCMIFI